jgi:rhodanese-related sulfurtransferase
MTISDMMPTRLLADSMHPDELDDALHGGVRVVDIRTQAERDAQGPLVGAVAIDAASLRDRLDPRSATRIAWATGRDVRWIVVCAHGGAAAEAARELREHGLGRAVGLIGGFRALKAMQLLDAVSGGLHNRSDAAVIAAH